MVRYIVFIFFIILFACDSKSEAVLNETGIVSHITSCSGGSEPVFIIKLSETGSIMTANLPDEFQIPNLQIQFKIKSSSALVYCTTDKIYPEQFDVYDVMTLLNSN